MVYERGRLVPVEHSERMRKVERERSFLYGAALGSIVTAVLWALALTVGAEWAILFAAGVAICWCLKDGGGGRTSGQAGDSTGGAAVGGDGF